MFKRCWQFLIDLLYPATCIGCGRLGELVCDRCYARLNFLFPGDLCQQLWPSSQEVYLDRVQALVAYQGLAEKILHQYKYQGVRDLGKILGYWLYEYLDVGEVDCITYIPLHRRRHRERGYNQAQIIAQTLADCLHVPCRQLLVRPIYRQNQALSRDKNERLSKTYGIFACGDTKICRDAKILLVDDVITTGATINEAARVLSEAGYRHISGVAIAHGGTS